MTLLEAKIRRRFFLPKIVTVFVNGENVFGGDEDVIKVRRTRMGVRLWTYWPKTRMDDARVMEWWFPFVSEVRFEHLP